ncbi:hypothetical protein V5O48_009154 [Marasmius crinis-equi]|uniref:C2H2-type domain-containing protein n=1 Tax=Marasmius crinis-equi TaxID=585013 RepID=A0ABR3FBV6_9AGAR
MRMARVQTQYFAKDKLGHAHENPVRDPKPLLVRTPLTVRTSTGVKDLQCPDCDFRTVNPSSLTRHRKRRHEYRPSKASGKDTLSDLGDSESDSDTEIPTIDESTNDFSATTSASPPPDHSPPNSPRALSPSLDPSLLLSTPGSLSPRMDSTSDMEIQENPDDDRVVVPDSPTSPSNESSSTLKDVSRGRFNGPSPVGVFRQGHRYQPYHRPDSHRSRSPRTEQSESPRSGPSSDATYTRSVARYPTQHNLHSSSKSREASTAKGYIRMVRTSSIFNCHKGTGADTPKADQSLASAPHDHSSELADRQRSGSRDSIDNRYDGQTQVGSSSTSSADRNERGASDEDDYD